MKAPPLVVKAVQHALKIKAKEGQTTKADVTTMVLRKIELAGGMTKFGVGAAMVHMASHLIVETEVTRQLKMSLTEHEYVHSLPATTPMEVIAALGKTPRWIAIHDGGDAIWKFSLGASPDDWMSNARLKYKKAHQTITKGRESEEISLFLTKHKFESLAEAMSKGV